MNLAVKLYNTADASIWLDEAFSIFHCQTSLGGIIAMSGKDPNPPLYSLCLGIWMKVFGNSPAAARSLSVLFNVATAPVLFMFCRRFLNIQTAVIASLLFTFSNVQILYAHEARCFALVTLLAVISFWFYLDILRGKSQRAVAGLAITNALLIYTHYATFHIFLAQLAGIVLFIWKDRKVVWRYMVSQVGAVVLFLPWVPFALKNSSQIREWARPNSLADIRYVYTYFFGDTWFLKALIVVFLVGLASLVFLKIRGKEVPNGYVLLSLHLWAIGTVVFGYAVSLYMPMFTPRYLLYACVGCYILVAYCLSVIPVHAWFKIAAFTVILWHGLSILDLEPHKGEDWESVAGYVHAHKDPDTYVLLSPWYEYLPFTYYYDPPAFADYENTMQHLSDAHVSLVNTLNLDFLKSIGMPSSVVIVQSGHSPLSDPDNTVYHTLADQYELVDTFSAEGVTAHLFKKEHKRPPHDIIVEHDLESDVVVDNWENLNTRSTEQVHSGSYASRTDSLHPFGICYRTFNPLSFDSDTTIVTVRLWAYLENERSNGWVTLTLDNKETHLFNLDQRELRKETQVTGQWTPVSFVFRVPPGLAKNTLLKVYTWNQIGEPLYIDDMEVIFSKQQH